MPNGAKTPTAAKNTGHAGGFLQHLLIKTVQTGASAFWVSRPVSSLPWSQITVLINWTSNPAFLGFNLVYLGMCLMFFNTILLIISLLAMIMFHLQIKYVEEPFLKQEFKEQYLQYYQQVNRYIGKRTGFK